MVIVFGESMEENHMPLTAKMTAIWELDPGSDAPIYGVLECRNKGLALVPFSTSQPQFCDCRRSFMMNLGQEGALFRLMRG